MKNAYSIKWNTINGFTLAELLIALAILGVIATFTIPKILDSGENGRRNAILKEAYSFVYEATYLARLQGIPLTNDTEVQNYYDGAINSVKICNNITADGCVNGTPNYGGWETFHGMKLHNGAILCYYWSPGATMPRFFIDYNAELDPNTQGEDEIDFNINPYNVTTDGLEPMRARNVTAASEALFLSLFSN